MEDDNRATTTKKKRRHFLSESKHTNWRRYDNYPNQRPVEQRSLARIESSVNGQKRNYNDHQSSMVKLQVLGDNSDDDDFASDSVVVAVDSSGAWKRAQTSGGKLREEEEGEELNQVGDDRQLIRMAVAVGGGSSSQVDAIELPRQPEVVDSLQAWTRPRSGRHAGFKVRRSMLRSDKFDGNYNELTADTTRRPPEAGPDDKSLTGEQRASSLPPTSSSQTNKTTTTTTTMNNIDNSNSVETQSWLAGGGGVGGNKTDSTGELIAPASNAAIDEDSTNESSSSSLSSSSSSSSLSSSSSSYADDGDGESIGDEDDNSGDNGDESEGGEVEEERKCYTLNEIRKKLPAPNIGVVFTFNYSIIFVLGLLGNVITLYVLLCKGKKRSAQDILIANLACSDIMLCVFAVSITPSYLIRDGHWTLGPVLCKVVLFAQSTSVYMSTYSLICIGYIRYRLIVHPEEGAMSKQTGLLCCLGTWLVGFIVTLPYMLQVRLMPENCPYLYCDEAWGQPYRFIFSLFTAFFQFIIPLGSVGFFNKKIYSRLDGRRKGGGGGGGTGGGVNTSSASNPTNLRACTSNLNKQQQQQQQQNLPILSGHAAAPTSATNRQQVQQQQHQQPPDVLAIKELRQREKEKRMRKANNRLIFVVVMFALSWLPLNLFNIAQDSIEVVAQWPYLNNIFLIAHQIACSSVCWNPILYAWMSESYRQELRSALPKFIVAKYFSSWLVESSSAASGAYRSTTDHTSHYQHHHHHQPHHQQQHLQLQHSTSKQFQAAPQQQQQMETTARVDSQNSNTSNVSAPIRELLPAASGTRNSTAAAAAAADQNELSSHQLATPSPSDGRVTCSASTSDNNNNDNNNIASSCCDLLNGQTDCEIRSEQLEQLSEIGSDEEIGVCSFDDDINCEESTAYDAGYEDDEYDECDRVHSMGGSCSGCKAAAAAAAAATAAAAAAINSADLSHKSCQNATAPAALNELASSVEGVKRIHKPTDCQLHELNDMRPASMIAAAALVNLDQKAAATTTTATTGQLHNQRSLGETNQENDQQQQQHRHHLHRRASCCSSILGDTVQIVV